MNPLKDITGFHVEPTSLCYLKCPGCARTEFKNMFPAKWSNVELDLQSLQNFIDISIEGKTFLLCGNRGDPIYYSKLFDLVDWIKESGGNVTLVTNGSFKGAAWWNLLVSKLDSADTVVFSIDGLPSNFTKYRINADWDSTHEGIRAVTQSDVKSVWKFIPFAFNQRDIEAAQELSNQLGFSHFWVTESDRWINNDELKPTRNFLEKRKSQSEDPVLFTAKCNDNNQHYISADGEYFPCCYLKDFRFEYKSEFRKTVKNIKIANTTLSQLLAEDSVVRFYSNVVSYASCQEFCSHG